MVKLNLWFNIDTAENIMRTRMRNSQNLQERNKKKYSRKEITFFVQ